tara:strand:- start:1696 stop:2151 length:456 start_codon:yes stop_codon:yes gene_type:complete
MDKNIDIEQLSKRIASNIESDQMSEESTDDFEKLKKLELLKNKLNKKDKKRIKRTPEVILEDEDDINEKIINAKMKKHKQNKLQIGGDIKDQLKQPIIVMLLFIIIAHPTFQESIISKIPLEFIKTNIMITLLIKGLFAGILFFFLKKVIK